MSTSIPQGLSNKHRVSGPLLHAVAREHAASLQHKARSHHYTTGAIDSPRAFQLKLRHRHELIEDAGDRIWALLGKIIHSLLEDYGRDVEGAVVEERLEATINGQTISCRIDLRENGIITDYKLTSSWAAVGEIKPEYVRQLNVNAHIARLNGIEVKGLAIELILRDWNKNMPLRNPDMPWVQWKRLDIPMWSHEKAEAYIIERMELHNAARDMPDNELPLCTPEELWMDPPIYAVIKGKGTRAVANGLKTTPHEADALVRTLDAKEKKGIRHRVEYRPSEPKRCGYCSASAFCNQFKASERERLAREAAKFTGEAKS